jgi:hypothetical protein
MATWASRRKTKYAFIVLLFLIIFVGIPTFFLFYKKPTCFDGKMNGDELDIDCGGSCKRLCQSAFISPEIRWGGARFENVGSGVYNASAYIENPNVNGGAIDVPYEISLLDTSGKIIATRNGKVNLYPHRNSLAFESLIRVDGTPVKALFRFTDDPNWFRAEDTLGNISIVDKRYEENENGSLLTVTLENKSLYDYKNIIVGAILYDDLDNVVGFSQTKIDSIPAKNGKEVAIFTWPHSRNGKVIKEDVILSTKPIQISN